MKIYFATDVKQVLERTLEPKAGARRTSSVTSGNNSAVKAESTSKRKKSEEPMPLPPVPPKTDIVPNPNAIH